MTSPQMTQTPLAAEDFLWRDRCKHHWLIEEPQGPTSWGQCKRCGARREFINDPEAARINAEERR